MVHSISNVFQSIQEFVGSGQFWILLSTNVASFFTGIFIRNKKLEAEREKWKQMADHQLRINVVKNKKIVELKSQVDAMIKENRAAHQRTQEYRQENNYMYAVLMRHGLFSAEDHKHMNAQRMKHIEDLFKNMHK